MSRKHERAQDSKKESEKIVVDNACVDSMQQSINGGNNEEFEGGTSVMEYEERLGSLKEEVKRLKKIKKQQKKINKLEEERIDVLREIEKRKGKEKKLKDNKKH